MGYLAGPQRDRYDVKAMRVSYICLSFVVMLSNACSGPTSYYVRHVAVDPLSGLSPLGNRSILEPASGSYYLFFHGANLTMVDHFERASKKVGRQGVLYFESKRNGLLFRTEKDEELFRGAYGAVYATKTCFYNKGVEDYRSGLAVGASLSDLGHEVPSVLTGLPQNAPPLTMLSLVRIYGSDQGYTVVAANYEADGRAGSLNVSRTKNGEWISGETVVIRGDALDARLNQYAIPRTIEVPEYVPLQRLPLSGIEQREVSTLVYRHYGFGKLIQEDTLSGTRVTSSRVLGPSVTDEEVTLGPTCDLDLRQQRAMARPTVN